MTGYASINEIACARHSRRAPSSTLTLASALAEALVSADTERGQAPLAQQPKMEKRYE